MNSILLLPKNFESTHSGYMYIFSELEHSASILGTMTVSAARKKKEFILFF